MIILAVLIILGCVIGALWALTPDFAETHPYRGDE